MFLIVDLAAAVHVTKIEVERALMTGAIVLQLCGCVIVYHHYLRAKVLGGNVVLVVSLQRGTRLPDLIWPEPLEQPFGVLRDVLGIILGSIG